MDVFVSVFQQPESFISQFLRVGGLHPEVRLRFERVKVKLEPGTIMDYRQAYGQGLVDKSEIVALNKCDALPSEEVEKKRRALEGMIGQTVTSISAIAGEGMDSVVNQLFERVKISNSGDSETDPQVLQRC